MSRARALLLSIKPRHAATIIDGSKTVELRRLRPQVQPGDLALVYATHPVCAVVAAFTIGRVVAQPPEELWGVVGRKAGINRAEYEGYYRGAATGVAIFVTEVRRLPEPVPLSDLRQQIAGFRPPQSFRYVPIAEWDDRILAVVEP